MSEKKMGKLANIEIPSLCGVTLLNAMYGQGGATKSIKQITFNRHPIDL